MRNFPLRTFRVSETPVINFLLAERNGYHLSLSFLSLSILYRRRVASTDPNINDFHRPVLTPQIDFKRNFLGRRISRCRRRRRPPSSRRKRNRKRRKLFGEQLQLTEVYARRVYINT